MAGAASDLVLLFYREYEADKFLPYDRYLKRVVRPVYNLFHHRQKQTGFYVSFRLLVAALERAGCEVRINDYRAARRQPGHPVGLVGFPALLDGWDLPNPALLGPSLYDHPGLAPDLMKDPRFRAHLVLAPWMHALFRRWYGEACVPWFAGVDLERWPDLSGEPKDVDVIVYDKIYWDRDRQVATVLEPVRRHLDRLGLTHATMRYKHYDHPAYRRLLARSRAMIFLSQHETQGLAYQEAMAANLPILAWDPGVWTDPLARRFHNEPVAAGSVPFFDGRCGERFATMAEFEPAFSHFWQRLSSYRPRDFVAQRLSPEESAQIYLRAYRSCAGQRRDAA